MTYNLNVKLFKLIIIFLYCLFLKIIQRNITTINWQNFVIPWASIARDRAPTAVARIEHNVSRVRVFFFTMKRLKILICCKRYRSAVVN